MSARRGERALVGNSNDTERLETRRSPIYDRLREILFEDFRFEIVFESFTIDNLRARNDYTSMIYFFFSRSFESSIRSHESKLKRIVRQRPRYIPQILAFRLSFVRYDARRLLAKVNPHGTP